ncbi:ATP-binding cassette domain-containing protein [Lactobacillus crispatus]|uniref:ATP-binding cassette domain-containing protein n=1 Tax=Lactobacillus crispatus TaxID=47770 RepID=UPI001666ADE8|nr:ABC transporter ATP-binding protein [Lactobacillus crispatus]MBD0967866.1 ATP-binding cassette domain-containing protein [Lactobacillus crispatus]
MIKVENLTITTRQPILKNFTATFKTGNIYQIMAENGAGKSTFLKALTQLVNYKGAITFDNMPFNQAKEKIFFFEENNWMDSNLNSLDYLQFVKDSWHSQHDIDTELNFWGIDQFAKVPIKKYSLGMKQKLIIAMYLVSDAQYLLMDEITNGLDEKNRNKLYSRLNDMVTLNDKCIILTSHYANEINNLHNVTKLKLNNLTMSEVK